MNAVAGKRATRSGTTGHWRRVLLLGAPASPAGDPADLRHTPYLNGKGSRELLTRLDERQEVCILVGLVNTVKFLNSFGTIRRHVSEIGRYGTRHRG